MLLHLSGRLFDHGTMFSMVNPFFRGQSVPLLLQTEEAIAVVKPFRCHGTADDPIRGYPLQGVAELPFHVGLAAHQRDRTLQFVVSRIAICMEVALKAL